MTTVPSQKGERSRHYQAWSAPNYCANDKLAVAVNSSSRHALSRRRQAEQKNICRTVQVLPERLRLSKVPAVHCNIAKTMGQPGNPE